MALEQDLETFLNTSGTIFDVRSPGEFNQGRIPGAISLSLFSDTERSRIGTIYKNDGHQSALSEGLNIIAPNVQKFIEKAINNLSAGTAKIHCWRGGMRSRSVALLLEAIGLRVMTLQGGYKTFRRWVLAELQKPLRLLVIGGLTGSGKTDILLELKRQGEQILDLEGLASHRGSAFGHLYFPPQPSNEYFENKIAHICASFDRSLPIWVEDESHTIGSCKIPDSLFNTMKVSPLYVIERPMDERLAQLKKDYWGLPQADLISSTQRIAKKLGGARTTSIITNIENGSLQEATSTLLEYYDSAYRYEVTKRALKAKMMQGKNLNEQMWAARLINEK